MGSIIKGNRARVRFHSFAHRTFDTMKTNTSPPSNSITRRRFLHGISAIAQLRPLMLAYL